MITEPSNIPASAQQSVSHSPASEAFIALDFREMLCRLRKSIIPSVGLTLLGISLGAIAFLLSSPFDTTTTSMRVAFAFNGSGKGEYPDHSKFQPDDIRSPDIVLAALKRQGLDTTEDFASKIRAAITIEGIIPANVTKERDRLRASGQPLAPYIPDEYLITMTLPRRFDLNIKQREILIYALFTAYQEKFQRTYIDIPLAFGNAFDALRGADYYEYEMILNGEIQNIIGYLNQQLDQARLFRSPTTNLSFNDLINQTMLFSQIRLFETLGLIRENGLSRDRSVALVKIDYNLHTLESQAQKAIEQEKVVDDLLTKSQERSQNYILGIKSQSTQQKSDSPMLDQNLIDSLLANDAYNFLVRQALAAGLKVKEIQAEKAQVLERRKDMEEFIHQKAELQVEIVRRVDTSLSELQISYNALISTIRKTHLDYVKQQFGDAIRVTTPPMSASIYRSLGIAASIGGMIGLFLGIGLGILGLYGKRNDLMPAA